MRIESGWNQEAEHFRLIEKRFPYQLVTGELLANYLFRNGVNIQSGILELGAGSGELIKNAVQGHMETRRLLPGEFQTSFRTVPSMVEGWVCTDVHRVPLTMMQEPLLAMIPKIVVESHQLPFASNRFPVVTDLAALDVVAPSQLPPILTEVKRVMAPGGRFMHFQDLSADPSTYIDTMLQAGFVSLPDMHDYDTYMTRVSLQGNFSSVWTKQRLWVEADIFNSLRKNPLTKDVFPQERKRLRDALAILATDPYRASRLLTFLPPVMMHEVAAGLRQSLTTYGIEFEEDSLPLNDWFTQNLTQALASVGFSDITTTRLAGERLVDAGRLLHHPPTSSKIREGFNDFSQTLGVVRIAKNPAVPINLVKVSSTIAVISAQAPTIE